MDVTPSGLRLVELAPGVTETEVRAATEPTLASPPTTSEERHPLVIGTRCTS